MSLHSRARSKGRAAGLSSIQTGGGTKQRASPSSPRSPQISAMPRSTGTATCSLKKIHQLVNNNSLPKILVCGLNLSKLDLHPHPLQYPRKPRTSLRPRVMLCPGVQIHCESLNQKSLRYVCIVLRPGSSDLLAIMLFLARTQSHRPFSQPSLL